jgi:hypothetical protein
MKEKWNVVFMPTVRSAVMSAPPPGSDGLGGFGDEGLSGKSASDPEEARAAAEDALLRIESMADLDEEPDVGASEGRTDIGERLL